MVERVELLLSEEKVNARIREMGEQISKDYAGKSIHLVGILKGGSFFLCELAKRITLPVTIDFMSASSYGMETQSGGMVKILKDLDQPVAGKHVLIVEDIVDTGRTLSYLVELMRGKGAADVKLCALLDKPERRLVEIEADYTGFKIPDEFVVGYGLDYAEKYRNLPYVGIVKFDE